jgi:hypothetical protein
MKDLTDRNKAAEARREEYLKKSYKGEVDGHGIEIIASGKSGEMNPEEWEYALRKYSSFVIQCRMAELNPNDIYYFKWQTITDPNTENKTSLHDTVVDYVDSIIYLVEKEGANLQGDTTFNKNYSN